MNIPEHPQIARTLATGHPEPASEPVRCDVCGSEFELDESVFLYDGEKLCSACCLDRVLEEYSFEKIAEAMKIAFKSLPRYLEEE